MEKKNLIVLIVMILVLIIGGYFIIKVQLCEDATCSDEPLIGGCAGVHPNYVQGCCDDWAQENGVVVIQCVGKWEIKNGSCSWDCD